LVLLRELVDRRETRRAEDEEVEGNLWENSEVSCAETGTCPKLNRDH
jgi:hypothetical protein